METIETIRGQLQKELREILDRDERVREAMRQKDPAGNWSYEDLGVEGEFDDVLDALGDRSRKELLDVWNALQRIEKGTYGTCVECGRKIGDDRLKALPAAEFCLKCAAKFEMR